MTMMDENASSPENPDKERLFAQGVYERYRKKYSSSGRPRALKSRPRSADAAPELELLGEKLPGEKRDRRSNFFPDVARVIQDPAKSDASEGPLPAGTVRRWVSAPGMARGKTGPTPSRWDPQTLESVLSWQRKVEGWSRPLAVSEVTLKWEEIVGPHVARHCPIETFSEGTLVARADSTAWAQQLQLLLPIIHKRIDEMVGAGVVEKVIVYPPKAPRWGGGRRSVPGRGPRDTYG